MEEKDKYLKLKRKFFIIYIILLTICLFTTRNIVYLTAIVAWGGWCYCDNILEKRIKRLENTIEIQEKYIKALEKFKKY